MNRTFDVEALRSLIGRPGPIHVSILMPVHATGPERAQDPIRYRNLLRTAADDLVERGLRRPAAERFLEPAQRFGEDAMAWTQGGHGLAVYASGDGCSEYRVPIALPERVVVADAPEIEPLLPLLGADGHFYVLSLSQHRSHLYYASRDGMLETVVPELDQGLDEVLRSYQFEKAIQQHSAPRQGPGRRPPEIFHGQGSGHDDAKGRILELFGRIDRAIAPVLAGSRVPLVLAGVDYLHPIYREANSYPHLAPEGVSGNFERARPEDLHARSLRVARPIFEAALRRDLRRFVENTVPEKASTDLGAIVQAARESRVDLLFLSRDAQAWGRPRADGAIESHRVPVPGDENFLNRAAIETIRHRGTIHVLPARDMPASSQVAALFRF